MKPLEDFKISVYKSNNSVENVETSLLNIIKAIYEGEWKDKVNTIRRYMDEGDVKAANTLKADLPCFTVAGTFRGGHAVRNLKDWTDLVILDFDKVKELEKLRAICNADPHTVTSFRSPKDGFKVVVHVINAHLSHREAYEMARLHYEQITGLKLDESGKDLSRTCLMSYDPDTYAAALYDSFVLPPQVEGNDCQATAADEEEVPFGGRTAGEEENPCGEAATGGEETSFAGREAAFVESILFLNPLHEGDRNQGVFRLGCRAAKAGCDFSATYSKVAEKVCNDTFTSAEVKQSLLSAYQHIKNKEATNSASAQEKNASKSTATPPLRHYRAATSVESTEETYQEGEEYRKRTPLMPDSLFDNLPEMILECLDEDALPRERDTRTLSCTVIFSALMPNTWGQYNHSRFSPHLYGWVIAPPAAGKKAADDASHLLDVTDEVIQAESDAALKKYERAKREYEDVLLHNRKAKEKKEVPEEPVEPPYKSLLISANTSNSRLIMSLRDNGQTGGIMFDTEAKVLTDNNKQDYGHLDSILCKAFGHETISSNFFAHGKKPVTCRRPLLALMLTSTTTQVDEIAGIIEGGLMSRFMLYTFRTHSGWKEMGGDDFFLDDRFEFLSQKAYRLFRFCEAHPLTFNFSRAQWGTLNSTFSKLLENAYLEDHEELQATVKRYAFCVMRVAMVYTRLHQFQTNDTGLQKAECPDRFFHCALDLVLCCYEHSRLIVTSYEHTHVCALKNPDRNVFPLDELPHRFSYGEAVSFAVSKGMSKRTAERILSKMTNLKIKKIGLGIYEKIANGSL